jgi:hypothetical protein
MMVLSPSVLAKGTLFLACRLLRHSFCHDDFLSMVGRCGTIAGIEAPRNYRLYELRNSTITRLSRTIISKSTMK